MKRFENMVCIMGLMMALCATFLTTTAFANNDNLNSLVQGTAVFEHDPDDNTGRNGMTRDGLMFKVTFSKNVTDFSYWQFSEGFIFRLYNARFLAAQRAEAGSNQSWYVWVDPTVDNRVVDVSLFFPNPWKNTGSIQMNRTHTASFNLRKYGDVTLNTGIAKYYVTGQAREYVLAFDENGFFDFENGGWKVREGKVEVTDEAKVKLNNDGTFELNSAFTTTIPGCAGNDCTQSFALGTDVGVITDGSSRSYEDWGVWAKDGPTELFGYYLNTTRSKKGDNDGIAFNHMLGAGVSLATSNPTGTSGTSATWTGTARGIERRAASASSGRGTKWGRSTDGEARLTVNFGTNPTLDARFTGFYNFNDSSVSGVSLSNGTFSCGGGSTDCSTTLKTLDGQFAGIPAASQDHEFVGGHFETSQNLVGVFVAEKD